MRTVRFRQEAEADLRAIVVCYKEVAPEALGKSLADIHRSINRLIDHPRSGMRVERRAFRRIVTLKYHFKIAYETDGD